MYRGIAGVEGGEEEVSYSRVSIIVSIYLFGRLQVRATLRCWCEQRLSVYNTHTHERVFAKQRLFSFAQSILRKKRDVIPKNVIYFEI